MKAHIRGALAPLVLLYRLPDTEAYRVFRAQAEQLGIAVRALSAQALGETVGALADGAAEAAVLCAPALHSSPNALSARESGAEDAIAATPLLLMAHFPDALVNTLLNALRAQNAPPLLKAVVTKHNKAWTLRALLQELLREQQKMEELPHEHNIR